MSAVLAALISILAAFLLWTWAAEAGGKVEAWDGQYYYGLSCRRCGSSPQVAGSLHPDGLALAGAHVCDAVHRHDCPHRGSRRPFDASGLHHDGAARRGNGDTRVPGCIRAVPLLMAGIRRLSRNVHRANALSKVRFALQGGQTLRIIAVVVLPDTASDPVTARVREVVREFVGAEQRPGLIAIRHAVCGRVGRQ